MNTFCERVGLGCEMLHIHHETHCTLWLYEPGSHLLVLRSPRSYFSLSGIGAMPPSGYATASLSILATYVIMHPKMLHRWTNFNFHERLKEILGGWNRPYYLISCCGLMGNFSPLQTDWSESTAWADIWQLVLSSSHANGVNYLISIHCFHPTWRLKAIGNTYVCLWHEHIKYILA